MTRIILYLAILGTIVFIPFTLAKNNEKKSFKRSNTSVNIKLVEPKVETKKPTRLKVKKPKPKSKKKKILKKKKPIKKKVVKKKIVPKKVEPKPTPLPEPIVEEKQEPPVVEEPIVNEEPKVQQESSTSNASEVDAYFALIYEEINKNKYYPKKARRFRQEDTIGVSFTIDADGRVSAFKILKESRYKVLNKAVQKMFKKMRKFAKPPQGAKVPLEMTIEINFNLEK